MYKRRKKEYKKVCEKKKEKNEMGKESEGGKKRM